MPYYYCSLPNDKNSGERMVQIITDDTAARDAFVQRYDVPGRAVYWCPNPLKRGATHRSLETLDCVRCLWSDLDHKDLVPTPEQIDERLLQLPLEPTAANDSGGGRHVFFNLKEEIDAADTEMFERVCSVQKRLAAALSADPAPAHPAA